MEKELKSQVASGLTPEMQNSVMVMKGMVATIIINAENIFMLLGNKLLDDGVEEEVFLGKSTHHTEWICMVHELHCV